MSTLADVRRAAILALQRPPRLPLSQWIEANVCLPQGLAAVPGPMRLWAHQRAIADSIGNPAVERVSILKSARVGYSSLLSAAIGYNISVDPGPILAVLPVESDCRRWLVDDIEPTFAASPVLLDKLRPPSRTPDERSTLLHRFYPGGSLKIVAARAPRNLRAHSARVLLLDEVDAFETSAEGDPLLLAERRTLTFQNRKIVAGSTPLEESTSAIAKLYEASDGRVFEIACPHCRASFEVRWKDVRWPPDDPGRAYCACPECGGVIEEKAKAGLVAAGRWRAQRSEVAGHHGYRLSALISPLPNASWGALAKEYLAAQMDHDRLRVFTNTLLGEPWRDEEDALDEHDLVRLCEDISLEKVPSEVLILTAGIDVQDDRFEVSILGHARDGTIFILEHEVIYGKPLDRDDDSWKDLDDHLRRRFRHPKGGELRVDAAAIDCGDGDSFTQVLALQPRAGNAGFSRSRARRECPGRRSPCRSPSAAGCLFAALIRLSRASSACSPRRQS